MMRLKGGSSKRYSKGMVKRSFFGSRKKIALFCGVDFELSLSPVVLLEVIVEGKHQAS